MKAQVSRRNFLKLSGQFAIGAGLAQMITDSLGSSPLLREKFTVPGKLEESFVSSLCGDCAGGCGLRLRLIDGIPVGVKGNELHPVNRGGVCVRGQASLQMLFNPDRIKGPLKRSGERGIGSWQEIDYQNALADISSAIADGLKNGKKNKIMILTGNPNGAPAQILRNFQRQLKLEHVYHLSLHDDAVAEIKSIMAQTDDLAFDYANANYILSFGSRLIEEESSAGWFTPVFSQLRGKSAFGRTTIVHIDPHMTPTGSKADEWIPTKPGTFGDIALCIAHVLLAEKSIDENRARAMIEHYDDWVDGKGEHHLGIRSILSAPVFAPKTVSGKTGVAASKLIRIAREFAMRKPAIAVPGERLLSHENGSAQFQAVLLLNALIGNINQKGGLVSKASLPDNMDLSPLKTLSSIELDQLLADDTTRPDILLCFETDPVYLCGQSKRIVENLSKTTLLAAFDSFPNDTTALCDYILPTHTPYERWQMIPAPAGSMVRAIGFAAPAIEPLYDTRDSGDVMLALLNPLLRKKTDTWDSTEAYLKSVAQKLYDSKTGVVFSESSSEEWIRSLQERGWSATGYTTFEGFWLALLKNGGWQQLEAAVGKGSSGKPGQPLQVQAGLASLLDAAATGVPSEEADVESPLQPKDIELSLSVFAIPAWGGDGRGAYSPMLLEIASSHIKQKWDTWVELNPNTATELGLRDRDLVRITAGETALYCQVRTFQGIEPGTAAMPVGLGHEEFGRFAKGIGVNPLRLIFAPESPNSLLDTTIKLTKKGNGEYHA